MFLRLNSRVFCKIELVVNSLINVNKKASLRTEIKKSLLNEVLFEAKELLFDVSVNKVVYC